MRSWRCGCSLALDVFFCKVGQLSNKSPPPITQCPPRFTLGAAERDLGADLKNNSSRRRRGRAIKYLPIKLDPSATREGKLIGADSRAFVQQYSGDLLLSLW